MKEQIANSNREFRKIKSLNYLYEINDNGTIFRNVKSKKQSKIYLNNHHSKKGYYMVSVHVGGRRKGNCTKNIFIHKLVAECWLGEKPNGYVIDHIDQNTHNNHYTNLRYCTVSENMKNRTLSDKIINLAKLNCLNYTLSVVAKKVIIDNKKERKLFRSMTTASYYLGNKYNVKPEHIRAKMKKRRKHIYDYDIIYLNAETKHTGSTEQEIVQVKNKTCI